MPVYEYKCPKCGKEDIEVREVDKRNDLKECPECKEPMKLKISKSSFNMPEWNK